MRSMPRLQRKPCMTPSRAMPVQRVACVDARRTTGAELTSSGAYHYADSALKRSAMAPPWPAPDAAISSAAVNRTGMPNRLKEGVEALSGISLDDVKVHYNSSRPAQLQAHAY